MSATTPGAAPERLELIDRPLTEAELELARVVASMIEHGGTMFRGRLVECKIARALGADYPRRGVSSWDLWLEGVGGIEVKSGRSRRFSIGRARRSDVSCWIFALLGPHSASDEEDWYRVVPADFVETHRESPTRSGRTRTSITWQQIDVFDAVRLTELAGAVRTLR